MDFDRELNQIICKYDLDRDYPQFRKMLRAQELLIRWMGEASRDNRKVLCVASNEDDIAYFSFLGDKLTDQIKYLILNEKNLNKDYIHQFDEVWIISLQSTFMAYLLSREGIAYTEIYERFQRCGLIFELECYSLMRVSVAEFGWKWKACAENIPLEIFQLDMALEFCAQDEKEGYLRRAFFLALYMRDFIYAQKRLEELKDAVEESEAYVRAWEEICHMLNCLKGQLQSRSKKDLVVVWMDTIGYDEMDHMPCLERIKAHGIDFENAFTVTPYTNETAKSIFLGTRVIDDKSYLIGHIDDRNSALISDLKNRNYGVRIASPVFGLFDNNLKGKLFHRQSSPTSRIFWDCICCMAEDENPLFFMAHAFDEIHYPFRVAGMNRQDIMFPHKRIAHGKETVDRQIDYYMDFWGDDVVRVFMSDHANSTNINVRSHIHLTVDMRSCPAKKIKGMFSIANFTALVRKILNDEEIGEELTTEFVRLQELPVYNKGLVSEFISGTRSMANLFSGYNGVATKEYIYFKINTGKERLVHRDSMSMVQDYFDVKDEIEDSSKLDYFRSLAGDRAVDIQTDEKFKYSRYYVRLADRYREHSKRDAVINELVSSYEDYSVAVRMGGENTLALYSILSEENRKKIACCIDRNENCLASHLGLPIVSPDDVNKLDIRCVVLSTKLWLDELYDEAKNYREDINVVDLFAYLARQGVTYIWHEGLYNCDLLPAEYRDVGFPFYE